MPCRVPESTFMVQSPDGQAVTDIESTQVALENQISAAGHQVSYYHNLVHIYGRTDLIPDLERWQDEHASLILQRAPLEEDLRIAKISLQRSFMVQGADPSWWNGQFNPEWQSAKGRLDERRYHHFNYDPWKPSTSAAAGPWQELVGAGRSEFGEINFTYSFVPAGTYIAAWGTNTFELKDHIAEILYEGPQKNAGATADQFKSEIRASFAEWKLMIEDQLDGVTVNFIELGDEQKFAGGGVVSPWPLQSWMVPLPDGPVENMPANMGDFRISMAVFPSELNALAIGAYPDLPGKGQVIEDYNGVNSPWYAEQNPILGVSGDMGGDIMFNVNVLWQPDTQPVGSTYVPNSYSIKMTAAHEIGHALGIAHPLDHWVERLSKKGANSTSRALSYNYRTENSKALMGRMATAEKTFHNEYGTNGLKNHELNEPERAAIRGIYGPRISRDFEEGQSFMHQAKTYYLEDFEPYSANQTLHEDGSFKQQLIEAVNLDDQGELVTGFFNDFKVEQQVGVINSSNSFQDTNSAATCTSPSSLVLSCWGWDPNTLRFGSPQMSADFKFDIHPDKRVDLDKEILYFNFKEDFEPSTSINELTRRLGINLTTNVDGEYVLNATDIVRVNAPLGTIPASQIEASSATSNWLRIGFSIKREAQVDQWTLIGKLESLGPDGLSPPSLLLETEIEELIDYRPWGFKNAFFHIFAYGMSDPDPAITKLYIDNFKLSPTFTHPPGIEDRDKVLEIY